MVDAGANIGQFTMLASTAAGPQGRVYSFEPVPSVFKRLEEHVRINRLANVTPVLAALWHTDSTVRLGLSESELLPRNSGRWTIADSAAMPGRAEAKAMRLDTFVRAHALRQVDVIKIDTEGAEPFVISGAREVLSTCHPTLLMEVNQPCLAAMGTTSESLWKELKGLGYRAWRIGSSPRRCGAVSDLETAEAANFILHHRELPDKHHRRLGTPDAETLGLFRLAIILLDRA